MIYRKTILYNYYLKWVRAKLRNNYLEQLAANEKPLFIHINRTGGTSIALGLEISPIHFSLKEYEQHWKQRFGVPMPEMTVYSSVRNPYHRAVSQYYFRIKSGQNKMQSKPISFDDWLFEVFDKRNPKYRDRELMFISQTEWLASDTEHQLKLIRFENLEDDYKRVLGEFNPEPLPWARPSERPDYSDVLNQSNK